MLARVYFVLDINAYGCGILVIAIRLKSETFGDCIALPINIAKWVSGFVKYMYLLGMNRRTIMVYLSES